MKCSHNKGSRLYADKANSGELLQQMTEASNAAYIIALCKPCSSCTIGWFGKSELFQSERTLAWVRGAGIINVQTLPFRTVGRCLSQKFGLATLSGSVSDSDKNVFAFCRVPADSSNPCYMAVDIDRTDR